MNNLKVMTSFLCAALSAGLSANDAGPQVILDETLWLHVPTVEYEGMPGYYQNVHFMMTQGGPWKLISFEAAVQITRLDRVEVIKTTEHPVQVFLEIDGTFTGGCREIGEVAVSMHEDEFVVGMYFSEESIRPEEPIDCTDAIRPFTEVVQLPVYGIEAGEYSFTINDVLFGSFTITEDNVLP